MLPTWYPISTSHILPSLVLSHCPEHAVVFVLCFYAFLMGIFLHFFSIFCPLIFINPQLLCTFQSFFSNFFSFQFLLFLLTHLIHRKKKKFYYLEKTKPLI